MKFVLISLISLLVPAGVFAENPEILINAQGLAQKDHSIRGSSYADAGMSLNGINLKVPYSAHFNAELPISGLLLSGSEVRTGLVNASGHLAGTSAMRTLVLEPRYSVRFGLGTEERYQTSVFSTTENIGGHLEWEEARTIDYDANDLERFGGSAFVQFIRNDWHIYVLSAAQRKEYGAQGYFGIPAGVYAEEQTEDIMLLAGAYRGDLDGSYIRSGINVREFDDEYSIPSSAFSTDTQSRYGSAMVEGRTLEIQHVALNLRGDLDHERVDGDIGDHSRTRGSILILPEVRFERVSIKAGLNSVMQSHESPEWLPMAGLDFLATDNIRLYSSYSETVMQPDFQSLYYTDPYRTGNGKLDMQHARILELGIHQYLSAEIDWQAAAFHRRHENAKDWVKATASDPVWTASDLDRLDVYGIDINVNYLASEKLRIQLYYQWIEKDEYEFYAGLYELDYPEQLLGMSGFWQVTPEIQVFGSQTLRYQTENNIRSGSDFGADASLGLHYDPRFAKNVRFSCLVENLWGSDFQAIPGLKPHPTSLSTGITVTW